MIMETLNHNYPNPNHLQFHEEILPSFENLSLNDSLASAALWYSRICPSNAAASYLVNPKKKFPSTTPSIWSCNNPTTSDYAPGNYYGGFSPSPWNSWNHSDGTTQNGYYNNVPWNQNAPAAQHCTYTRPRNNIVVEAAKTRNGSLHLQRILKEGNLFERQQIFDGILGSIFEVMANEYGHHLFQRLLERCSSRQFNAIFATLVSDKDSFIDVSLSKHGSTAIQALIKKLKKSGHGYTVTAILSQRFLELMTGEQGRYVVQQCFNTFKPKENEVLYEAAVRYFRELATSEYGCASLNVCLSCISGVQKVKLLFQIAEHSDFLSNDPWGHFVVQHVLVLKDENITRTICNRLQNQYFHLAQIKGGSHVVEKIIRSSELGMNSVVRTLLQNEKALLQLASDQFGNYVIQTALRETKERNNVELFGSLVSVLKKRNSVLSRNAIGRHVANKIKEQESGGVENSSHV